MNLIYKAFRNDLYIYMNRVEEMESEEMESEEELVEKRRIAAERDRLMKVWQKYRKVVLEEVKTERVDDPVIGDGKDDVVDKDIDDVEARFFWYYDEADCWIPPTVVNIPSIDKVNTVLWRGDRWVSTEIFSTIAHYTVEEYHNKFCKWSKKAEKWIYKE